MEEEIYELVDKNQEEIVNQDLVEKVQTGKKPVKNKQLRKEEGKTSNQYIYSSNLRNVLLHAKSIILPFIKSICRSK